MRKNLLSLSLLSIFLISSQNNYLKCEDSLPQFSIKQAATEGAELKHSKIYHQNGTNSQGHYCLRFATAVYGDFDAISYFVKIDGVHDDYIEKEVKTVYKGIKAENGNVYYDGTNLTSVASDGWYWACYTIEYSSPQYYSADISAYVEISSQESSSTVSLEMGSISLAQSIKALDTKITNRKYTGSLLIGDSNKKATTLEYVDNRLVVNVDSNTYTLKYASFSEDTYQFVDANSNILNIKVENNHLLVNGTINSQSYIDSVLNVDLNIRNTHLYLKEVEETKKLTLEYEGNAYDLTKEDLVFEYAKLDPWPWQYYTPDFDYSVNNDTFKISIDLSALSSKDDKVVNGNTAYQKYVFYCQLNGENRTSIPFSTYSNDTRPMALSENGFIAIPYNEWGPAALKITNANTKVAETNATIYKKDENIYLDLTITGENFPVEDIVGVQASGADDWSTKKLSYVVNHDGKYTSGSSNEIRTASFSLSINISSLPVSTGDKNGHVLQIVLSNGKSYNILGSAMHTDTQREEVDIEGKIYTLRGIWGNFTVVIPA